MVVGVAELVGLLLFQSIREGGIQFKVMTNVAASALNEIASESFPLFSVTVTGQVGR